MKRTAFGLFGLALVACAQSSDEEFDRTQSALNQSSCSCVAGPPPRGWPGSGTLCILRDGAGNVISTTPSENGECSARLCGVLLQGNTAPGQKCEPLPVPTETTPWNGNYDIHDNNCHHAANGINHCSVGQTRVLMCRTDVVGPNLAHSVNISSYPCADPNAADCTTHCAFEPQLQSNAAACCWNQTGNGASTPNVSSGSAGGRCAEELCGAQFNGTQHVVDQAPTGPEWCAANQAASCDSCCEANTWVDLKPTGRDTLANALRKGLRYTVSVGAQSFLDSCKVACAAPKPGATAAGVAIGKAP
jgi:hypothetical protein